MQDTSSFYDYATQQAIPSDLVRKIINRQNGTVQIGARFRVVDTLLNRKAVIVKPKNWDDGTHGAFDPSDISIFITPDAGLNHDQARPVHREITFTMMDPAYTNIQTLNPLSGNPGFPFDPLHCFLEVAMILTNSRGKRTQFEVPMGHYIAFLPAAEIRPGVRFFKWIGLDLTALVAQTPFISDYVVYQNYPGGYLGAAMDMLTSGAIPISQGVNVTPTAGGAGTQPTPPPATGGSFSSSAPPTGGTPPAPIGGSPVAPVGTGGAGTGITPTGNDDAGPAIPKSLIDFSDNSGNQPVLLDTIFAAGSSRLDAVNQLFAAINYSPLWMRTKSIGPNQNRVTFTTGPTPFFQAGVVPIPGWDYSTLPNSSIVESPVGQDFSSQADTLICNIVRVEGTPTSGGAQTTTYSSLQINTNPNSVVSVTNLTSLAGGARAISKFEKNDTIANQAMADLRCKILLQQGAMLPENLQLSTLHNPLHESNDVLICQVTDKRGTVLIPSSINAPFIEQSFDLPLKATSGRMTHQLSRIVAL